MEDDVTYGHNADTGTSTGEGTSSAAHGSGGDHVGNAHPAETVGIHGGHNTRADDADDVTRGEASIGNDRDSMGATSLVTNMKSSDNCSSPNSLLDHSLSNTNVTSSGGASGSSYAFQDLKYDDAAIEAAVAIALQVASKSVPAEQILMV